MASVVARTVDVERERGVTVIWDDDHVSRFALTDLRTNCPCAQCRGMRQAGEAPWPGGALRIESAETVGNWGMNVTWSDGHSTGVYAWDVLRLWCPCDECEGEAE
jgi:DUF971 family protein